MANNAPLLNLGCGDCTPHGWENVDYAFGARLTRLPGFSALNRRLRLFNLDWDQRIRLHDLRKPLPWQSGSVQAVYSSHTLEHLSREQGRRLIEEAFRVLMPGGILRIVVPDLAQMVRDYTSGTVAADYFLDHLGVLTANGDGSAKEYLEPLISFPHKCMYDQETLLTLFGDCGFNATPRSHLDSDIPDIGDIETAERTHHAVVVEGTKPFARS